MNDKSHRKAEEADYTHREQPMVEVTRRILKTETAAEAHVDLDHNKYKWGSGYEPETGLKAS